MTKNKSPFNKRKKSFSRATMNMDGKGVTASHNQTTLNADNIELSWKQTFSPTILESKVPQKFNVVSIKSSLVM